MVRYGWFSAKMAAVCGYVTWIGQDGIEFKVTTVTNDMGRAGSNWGDEVRVGTAHAYLSGSLKSWYNPDAQSNRPRRRRKKNGHDRSN